MLVLKYILAFICCIPFWVLLVGLFSDILDRMGDGLVWLDENAPFLAKIILVPILGLLTIVVQMIMVGFLISVWGLAELLIIGEI